MQQLIKKNSQEGRYEDIFPKTFIDAVLDKESGVTLTDILAMFNMLFLSYYNDSRSQTRLQVPSSLRRKGLWVTYVLYDKTVVTEWYSAEAIDDTTFGDSANWRDGSNALVGDISISSDGYWVINGEVTNIKAQGEAGITPILRVGSNNHLQVSYTNGSTYVDVSPNPVFTQFRVSNNKLEQSVDLGLTWTVASNYIAAWFRFTGTTGSSQADNVGKIQISRDNGATWSDLSGEFTNSLHIKGYVATVGALPSTAVQGDIYGVGPTYDTSDTEHTNPIYQLYVKDSTGWVNNGRFTSISAGVVQELGNSGTATVSQKVITEALDKQKYKLYPSMGIFGMPAVDYNHVSNYDSEGAFSGYIPDDNYDCAWVYIFEGSTTIKVEGATPSIIGYFSGKTPELGTLLGKGTIIPSGAKLCLVNFIKAENPNGYANLVIRQEGMASSVEAVNSVEERLTLLEPTETVTTELTSSFEATPISKNFLDTKDILVGWGFSDGNWVKNTTLNSSGKIYLKDSQTYTAQNVRAYGTNLNMYIAAFDIYDNYLGRTVITFPSENNLKATFLYSRKEGEVYQRVVLKSATSTIDPSNMQIEEGFTATTITSFAGYLFNKPTEDFISQIKGQYKQLPKGKNYINMGDILCGYTTEDGQWIPNARGRATNKLFLTQGQTYTAHDIAIYNTTIRNMYLILFDENDNFIRRIAYPMTVDSTGTKGSVTFTYNIEDAFYVRILLQSSALASVLVPTGQLEEGSVATVYEPYAGTIYEPVITTGGQILKDRNILLTGASFAYSGNEWFDYVCKNLNVTGYNKAVSDETMQHTAQKIHDGTLYSQAEFEDFDVLLIFHSHNQAVNNTTNIKTDYNDYTFPITDRSAQWDYVLKKYAADCYAARLNPDSRWYGTKYGKPYMVVVCTHWHDARTIFNDSIRELQKKWGFILCEFDTRIGFSKNQVHPVTGEQVSILHCDNPSGDTEVINGVTYGWHPTRDKGAWIQHQMASIVESTIRNL